ncbi:hypothetical protein IMCC21224_113649 [Puniceibacterium sp. IMCC21224]|nr:hypothetical protein IMCC21224_113649 [Puniceibacterium sp. IMCC21224]
MALGGLAFSPAIAVLFLPESYKLSMLATLGLPLATALICLIGFFTTKIASQSPTRRGVRPRISSGLLRRNALRRPAIKVPAPQTLRAYLGAVLTPDSAESQRAARTGPETVDHAVARAMLRILDSWGMTGDSPIATLPDDRLAELYLFDQLMRGTPDLAGALAQQFRSPDILLALRDQIGTIATRRATFERQRHAFDATRRAWDNQSRKLRPSALLTALQALDWPDSDLWHKVVMEHDPTDPAQREAALWCALQPSCDRTTVAAYLANLTIDGHLDAGLQRRDHSWLAGVQTVIENWNDGHYTRQLLALDPPDAVSAVAPHLSQILDQMATTTGQARWPDPRGLFAEYHGRAPRPRDNWCLQSGQLTAPPTLRDYVEVPARDVA